MIFCQNSHFWPFFGTFWSKFSKIFEKTVPRELYYHDFQAILAFLTQNYFFLACHKIIVYQKSDFLPFKKSKNSIFGEI